MCMLLMLVPSARAWGTAAWNNPEQLGTEFSFQNGLMPPQGLARPLHDPAQLIDMMRVQQEMLRVQQEMLRSVQEMLTSQEKSHVAFRDCVLHNQADLLAQVNSLRQQLGNKSLVKVVYLPDDCPSLPVNSLDDLRALNVYLEARDKLQHMVDYYSQKGGTDKNADTRALLTCLVHNDVAGRCSWKGSKGRKEPFDELKNIMTLLLAAGKAKYADLTEATIQDVTKRWLWSFVDRDGGRSKRRHVESENVQ
ncbi:uncharacterized protein LOC120838946 [Ixodes scapularis]|uniref:uncharacterized protein LOC120838946 n=1 Tax=Ixodes scapularis TaxID=6945 RepID=UPI001C38A3E8|nr:uncharacterized protein LOC120838946 [Ixodes scapularis]